MNMCPLPQRGQLLPRLSNCWVDPYWQCWISVANIPLERAEDWSRGSTGVPSEVYMLLKKM